jgi:hypothetical protein
MSSDVIIKDSSDQKCLELSIKTTGLEIVSFGEPSLENYELDGPAICHWFSRRSVEDRKALENLISHLQHQLTIWVSLEESEE